MWTAPKHSFSLTIQWLLSDIGFNLNTYNVHPKTSCPHLQVLLVQVLGVTSFSLHLKEKSPKDPQEIIFSSEHDHLNEYWIQLRYIYYLFFSHLLKINPTNVKQVGLFYLLGNCKDSPCQWSVESILNEHGIGWSFRIRKSQLSVPEFALLFWKKNVNSAYKNFKEILRTRVLWSF